MPDQLVPAMDFHRRLYVFLDLLGPTPNMSRKVLPTILSAPESELVEQEELTHHELITGSHLPH